MQAVILSGGAGSRLWPVSSKTRPKPFIKMQDGKSLIQQTLLRACGIESVRGVIAVTNCNFVYQLKEEYKNIDCLNERNIETHFILEPFGKNTAAAIAFAALYIYKTFGPDETMLILPADHLISDEKLFQESVAEAEIIAKTKKIVTFGIKPNRPETGYGYIETDNSNVKRFVEKPSRKTAENYINNGNFFWNSGIFCFTAQTLLDEMEKHCPEILRTAQNCMKDSIINSDNQLNLNSETFALIPENSIDYALMEKSQNIKMIACDIGWNDIGTWDSFSKLSNIDSNGNSIKGNALLHKSSGCHVETNDKKIMVVGASNLVIVNTNEGTLVIDKNNTDDIKEAYKKLQNQSPSKQQIHKFSWGRVLTVETNSNFKMYQIEVSLGAKLNISKYFDMSANWTVLFGIANFMSNNKKSKLVINESKYIPAKNDITLINDGNNSLVMIVMELSDYLFKSAIMFA